MAKTNKKPAAKAASVNPMKDGPEENDGKVKFETEELATYAAEAAEEYGLELGEMVGTGPDGVITAGDVDAAVTAADNMEDPNAVNFASEDAGEFYAENEEKIDLDEVEGTGKDGAITVDDLKAVIPAEPAAEAKFTTDTVKEAAEEVDEIKSIIDDLVSFGPPVRGRLKNQPKVLARWLELQKRAVKVQRAF